MIQMVVAELGGHQTKRTERDEEEREKERIGGKEQDKKLRETRS